jgi:hypothetical protein
MDNYKVLSLSPSLFRISVIYSAANDTRMPMIIKVMISFTPFTKSFFFIVFGLHVMF